MLKEKETVSDEFCWHLSNGSSTPSAEEKSVLTFPLPKYIHFFQENPFYDSIKRVLSGALQPISLNSSIAKQGQFSPSPEWAYPSETCQGIIAVDGIGFLAFRALQLGAIKADK